MPWKLRREAHCAHCRKSRAKPVRLAHCDHALCRECLASVCTSAAAAAARGGDDPQPFTGARCSACSREIPLDTVQQALPASLFAQYKRMWLEARSDCVSCANVERTSELRVMACGHRFCRECVRRMSRLALGDRTLVPLQCCQKELPIDYIYEALPAAADRATYARFLQEKSWRASDLVSDAEYAQVVTLVGGKQCPGCGVGVQRDFGCVHITCPNGHEFCFTCLREWQTCACPLIPEAELTGILGD
ncbi:hypothetical protein PybrP1_011312 [[Pythium] brassicae (nom. inval.)]|nr:hypothetical protein PybrP1_011312 [[Pythium] brassicae (nom. inval.)]